MPTLPQTQTTGFGQLPVSARIILILAVLLCAWSGFFIMDFLLSGIYTWPRASGALALVCAMLVLSWEFVYQEHRTRHAALTGIAAGNVVWYCCGIPYLVGTLALVLIAR